MKWSDEYSTGMRMVADGIIRLYRRRDTIRGLRFTYEPTHLRFFQGPFAPIDGSAELSAADSL
jgi:tryptophanase